jgi:type I restriction enzyme, S subunit
MKKYDTYKDSGIEWIGEIPSHWESVMIKRLSPVKRGASPRPIDDPKYFDDNGEYSWVRIADVSASERYLESTTQTLSELGASLSVKREPGHFFLSIAGTVGKPIITRIKCCIHDGFVYFPDLKIDPEYLYYIFSTGLPYQGLGKWGTQLNLNTDTVGEIYIPIPHEIDSIVSYLDRKTAEIDELIADKKRLLELYEEEKTAIINQAVTKGINPDAPIKDSGIEWLGEIPEHWYATSLKRLVETKITDGPHETPTFLLEGVPFVSAEAVKNGKIDFNYARGFISEEDDEKYSKKCKPKRNDIFIVKSGSTTGKIALVDFDDNFNIWSPLALVRVNKKVDFMFMYYALQSTYFQDSIKLFWSYGTQPNIGMNVIENLKVAFAPDLNEQLQIIRHIEQTTLHIDNQIYRIQKLIELLTEYRTALISEVVTGKIKVTE